MPWVHIPHISHLLGNTLDFQMLVIDIGVVLYVFSLVDAIWECYLESVT